MNFLKSAIIFELVPLFTILAHIKIENGFGYVYLVKKENDYNNRKHIFNHPCFLRQFRFENVFMWKLDSF